MHVDDPSAPVSADAGRPDDVDPTASQPGSDPIDLTGLSVAGFTRRRIGWASAGLAAVWVVVMFARQVGDAQAAANRAVELAADNAALATEVDALERELDLVVRPDYVGIEARGHNLGTPKEIPFTLDPSVPSPVDGAPGSASVRLGAAPADRRTPLESWLSLLFGPTD